jgi:hypothetical protein
VYVNFFGNGPLVVKTCGESEFDIFEAKKHFPDSGNPCVLKRKVEKIAMSNSDSLHVFTPRGVISRRNL